jgi:hypothetical protein
MPPNSSATRVEIERTNLTENGQRYRVMCAGEILAEGRRNPIFDACRALLARGITGRLEVWRRGRTSADMQLGIGKGAGLTVAENDYDGLRLRPYKPKPDRCRRGKATAAISGSPVPATQTSKTAASDSTARRDEPWA